MEALLWLVLLLFAFVFLVILPSRQRSRQHAQIRTMQDALSIGDPVMTTSGLYGTIVGLGDKVVELEIAPGTVVHWERLAIAEIKSPVDDRNDDGADAESTDGADPPAAGDTTA